MRKDEIPKETVNRLPIYLRCLNRILLRGHSTISSDELANLVSMSPAKIRKDLSYFGKFGTRGVGYEVKPLIERIRGILNLDKNWKLALVGVGNVGSALLSHPGFHRGCFKIELVFDDDPELIGKEISGKKVHDSSEISNLVEKGLVQIGIIAVPNEKARDVAERLVRGGVTGIINFAPVSIDLHDDVKIYQIDISTELSRLTYHMVP
ncbi:redox-sensing transcriptional repressor Rex [Candidatus Bipolaricaulota bacterium]|nr:redox-sensing transcriptional repressor Rex [Candidatus Bipolaricaulota bacterium]